MHRNNDSGGNISFCNARSIGGDAATGGAYASTGNSGGNNNNTVGSNNAIPTKTVTHTIYGNQASHVLPEADFGESCYTIALLCIAEEISAQDFALLSGSARHGEAEKVANITVIYTKDKKVINLFRRRRHSSAPVVASILVD
ncbi:hypothetical protein POSPLADRAFT_1037283 [Postia placenta MAD-698-R-SB12]|uniref:Uncharacterized protein n=1 Tax=Postia placenta MAD-698-R-SB12 TaxID=670580 RepID=A0A1X6MKQ7_9APHY|nr:hypothetical protein POSPLADRAFT_1037283 [Postia placenta MAD-698-R-SB12]OSX56826.1 hypothetical protein POSPLADRAFT_1037283 [Postia placenta MAD-698-R-SB12]